jgi:hypothetical protein
LPGVDEETVRIEVPEAPELRVTLVGLRATVEPEEGTTEVERVIVPENPFRLLRLIVEVADEPAWTVRADELLEIEKSGASVTVTMMDVE